MPLERCIVPTQWDSCPGQSRQFWKPDDIFDVVCPHCDNTLEFFKDDLRRRCRTCGNTIENPRLDMGCAMWCAHADKCFSAGREEDPLAQTVRLKARLIAEMKHTFDTDDRRIAHALKVLSYAEQIMESENGYDALVVAAAAVLHDIGIPEAERLHGSASPVLQMRVGPPIARRIMQSLGIDTGIVEQVAEIIANHHIPDAIDSMNFFILIDADCIVNIQEGDIVPREFSDAFFHKHFATDTGRAIAKKLFAPHHAASA